MAGLNEGDTKRGRPDSEFPDPAFATTFADGVAGYALGPGIVKFFLYRVDPNAFGRGGTVSNPFVQVVMPVEGFARAIVLLQRALREIMKNGAITQADLDKMDEAIQAVNAPNEAPVETTT